MIDNIKDTSMHPHTSDKYSILIQRSLVDAVPYLSLGAIGLWVVIRCRIPSDMTWAQFCKDRHTDPHTVRELLKELETVGYIKVNHESQSQDL